MINDDLWNLLDVNRTSWGGLARAADILADYLDNPEPWEKRIAVRWSASIARAIRELEKSERED